MDDEFYNYQTQNETSEEGPATSFTEIAFLVSCSLSVVIDVLLIIIYLHFKRLFSVTNTFLVNWCIADAIRIFISPSVYVVLIYLISSEVSRQYSCFVFCMEDYFELAAVIFQTLIVVDWLIENFWSNKLTKWRKNYGVSVVCVWAPLIFSAVVTARVCAEEGYYGFMYEIFLLYHAVYPLLLLTVVIVRCICKCRKRNLDNSSNLIYVMCAIELIFILTTMIENYYFHKFFYIILEFCSNATPLLLLVFLLIESSQFRSCLKQVLTCKVNEDDNYTRETLTGFYCKRCQETLQ